MPYRAHLLEAPTTIEKKKSHIQPSRNLSGARAVQARNSGFRKHFHEGRWCSKSNNQHHQSSLCLSPLSPFYFDSLHRESLLATYYYK